MLKRFFLIALCLMFVSRIIAQDSDVLTVTAVAETEGSPGDGPTTPLIWLNPTDPAQSLLIGTDDNSGIGIYDLNGALLSFEESYGGLGGADLRYKVLGFDNLIAAAVSDESRVQLLTLEADSQSFIPVGLIETGIRLQGACLYHSPLNSSTYIIAYSEYGQFEQYLLSEDDGEITSSLARSADVGGELEGCTVDDSLRRLYFSEGEIAVWRYGAEPEDGIQRRLVDIVGEHIEAEIEGLAIYATSGNEGYLIVSNQSANSILLYERTGDNAFVGEFEIGTGDTIDSVSEPSNFAISNLPLDERFPQGLFVTNDDVNSNPNANSNFKLVSWGDIAAGLGLVVDAEYNPRSTVFVIVTDVALVSPVLETIPVAAATDAADDPAIWVHPTNPELSLIIGTDKRNGLVSYNLDGTVQQTINVGRLNNVDLRDGFILNGEAVSLVIASNRTDNSLLIYAVDVESRELVDVAARTIVSNVEEVYGVCMYRSANTGLHYVIVNSADTGEVEQYELFESTGKVDVRLVRSFVVGSQTEGCVADDELGFLYIGEEAVGLWKYGAEADATDERIMLDTTAEGGHLTADVEGMALYLGENGTGYLIVSSQGSSSFVVYERQGDNAYVGTFSIIQGENADAVSGTDGLDVSSVSFGSAFPDGLLVVQDDLNINPEATQNFKLISWASVAEAMGLSIAQQ